MLITSLLNEGAVIKTLEIAPRKAFLCPETFCAHMGSFELVAELNPLAEGPSELSDHIISHLAGKVIHKFLQVIQGFMFVELVQI